MRVPGWWSVWEIGATGVEGELHRWAERAGRILELPKHRQRILTGTAGTLGPNGRYRP
jgi:hypothetical protein